jgi:type IX secretion system PorP/SprF family membrane protein
MHTKIISVSKYLVLALIGLLIGSSASAQDIHFSQLMENPLTLNPALGGAFDGTFLAEANYRNQWSSVAQNGNGYTTTALNLEIHNMLKNFNSGFLSPGLSIFEDESGDAHITQLEIAFNLAMGLYLNDNNCLTIGLQAGWDQNSIQLGGLEWDDQYINGVYNPNAPNNENYFGNSLSYSDFSMGAAYHYGTGTTNMSSHDGLKFSAGAAFYHINEPTISFYNVSNPSLAGGTELYMRESFYADMDISVPNSNLDVLPVLIYMKQGPAWEVDAGAKLRYIVNNSSEFTSTHKGSAIDLGFYYRLDDAAIALVGYEWGNYALGISYDFNTSALTTASHGEGGFEISLRFINLPSVLKTTGTSSNRSMF